MFCRMLKLKVLLEATTKAQLRTLSTSAVRCGSDTAVVDQRFKDVHYPKVGERDIVGSGTGSYPMYFDLEDTPFPAIRFGKNSPEIMALREKEKGDWKELTLEERKRLYRHSFRQTLAEKSAPQGHWKVNLSHIFSTVSGTFFILLFLHYFVYPPPGKTLTEEWKRAMVKKMLRQNQGAITGISSKYDYETGDWKKK